MLLRTRLAGLRDYGHRLWSSGFRSGSPSLKIAILKSIHIIGIQKETWPGWIYDNKHDQPGGICYHRHYLNKAFIQMNTIHLLYLKQFFQWLTVHLIYTFTWYWLHSKENNKLLINKACFSIINFFFCIVITLSWQLKHFPLIAMHLDGLFFSLFVIL